MLRYHGDYDTYHMEHEILTSVLQGVSTNDTFI